MHPEVVEADFTWTGRRFEDGIKVEIGDDGSILRVGQFDRPTTSRLSGKALLPGFVNVHSHAFQRGLRGKGEHFPAGQGSFWTWRQAMYQLVDELDDQSFHQLTLAAFQEMRACGITTVGEFHYLHHSPRGRDFAFDQLVVEAAQQAGIRLVLLNAAYMTGGLRRQLEPSQWRFATPGIDEYRDHMASLATDLPESISLGVVAHSVRAVPLPEIVSLHDWAVAQGYPFHIHLEEQRREVTECVASLGGRPMELLLRELPSFDNVTAIHCTHTASEDLVAFLERGGTIGLCPLTEANLGDGLCDLALARSVDGRVALGTDSNARISMQEEMRWMEYGQRLRHEARGVLADDAGELVAGLLASATVRGASALGLPAGDIAPGLLADFCLIDLEHPSLSGATAGNLLAYLILGSDVDVVAGTCVGGSWRDHGQ